MLKANNETSRSSVKFHGNKNLGPDIIVAADLSDVAATWGRRDVAADNGRVGQCLHETSFGWTD